MKQDKLTQVTKYILDFMFYAGIAVIIALPLIIKIVGGFDPHFIEYAIPLYILYLIDGIFAVLIIRELRSMFKSVLTDDCFVKENVVSLKRMGTYSFCIAIVIAFRMLFYVTVAVLVVILVFVIAGLFSKVLARVFDRAVSYKLENDLTI